MSTKKPETKAGEMLEKETALRELEIEKAKGSPLKKEADRFEDFVDRADGHESTKKTQQT